MYRFLKRGDGGFTITFEHLSAKLICEVLEFKPAEYLLRLEDNGFCIITPTKRILCRVREEFLGLTLYSQRDPRWRDEIYAGNMTFGAAGCYTVCAATILSLAGYDDTPPEVARKLRDVGCFSGALLTRPDLIPVAYPKTCYDGPVDVSRDGPLRWHHGEADMERFKTELAKSPVIIEVDFAPPTAKFNQHFVCAEKFTPDGKDLIICDPWDGVRTQLLTRYAQDHWDLQRAIYGMRLLRVKQEG